MRVYLDNCCFNRPFDEQANPRVVFETEAKLLVQQQILRGNYELAWSYVLDYEIERSPFAQRQARIRSWKNRATISCQQEDGILTMAEKFRRRRIKIADSLHIACAVFMRCDYLLTTDRQMLNKPVTEIAVVNPINFVQREIFYVE
ncbi:MAG: PIN domain protein [Planctomycetota bacterium]|jgi:predicted nucleic acid-binding protein|nr:PIN domain protein [Planctomycetota bacterium]